MDGILSQQFSADWARVAMKQRFVALIGRSDKDRMAGDSDELQAGVKQCKLPELVFLHPSITLATRTTDRPCNSS